MINSNKQVERINRLGRPVKPDAKRPVSIRLSPQVLEAFKSTGAGWQTRIDAVLLQYVIDNRQS